MLRLFQYVCVFCVQILAFYFGKMLKSRFCMRMFSRKCRDSEKTDVFKFIPNERTRQACFSDYGKNSCCFTVYGQ